MKRWKLSCIGIAIFLPSTVLAANATTKPDPVNDRIDAQDKRIDAMDKKMDQILQLLQGNAKQTKATPAATSTTTPKKAKPAKTAKAAPVAAKNKPKKTVYKPGPLLDIYVIENSAVLTQPDASIGTMIDKTNLFSMNAYKKDDAFKDLQGQSVGHYWHGLLKVNASGKHVFSYEYNTKKQKHYNHHQVQCNSNVALEGQELFLINGGLSGNPIIKAKAVELEKGYYKLAVWSACHVHFQKTAMNLKIRGPNDRTSRLIDGKIFLHEK